MGYDIYINYLASMEAHIGALVRDSHGGEVKDLEFARPSQPADTKILACVSVFSSARDFPSTALINEIIDEGFQHIGNPAKATLYKQATKSGSLELMWRPGFPNDPASAKAAIHEAAAVIKAAGPDLGIYCGKPARLFRYGKRDHLAQALEIGRFRINPATFYNDITDDPARQDDEMCRTFVRDPDSLVIKTSSGTLLTPKGPVKFVSKRAEDYYVLCFSIEYSAAVANEFKGTDTCLVIRDPIEFTERLHAGIVNRLPDYKGFEAAVSYGTKSALGVCFTKVAGYSVQSEFRFAWTSTKNPAAPVKLDPFFVEIGSIKDIAELVDLPK
jgi:hypothetical protein